MTNTPIGGLTAATSVPTGGKVLIAQPSAGDPTKFVFGAVTPSAISSSSPVVNAALKNIFPATAYGSAIWDSTHDVIPAINLAMAAAYVAGGGIVLLPAGTFGIGGRLLHNYSGVTLRGVGHGHGNNPATVLKWIGGPGGTMVQIGNTIPGAATWGAGFEGIYLDCNQPDSIVGQATVGIYVVNFWGGVVDAYVKEPWPYGGAQPVCWEIGGGVNLTNFPFIGWQLQAAPLPAGSAIAPINTYVRPNYPVGLWVHGGPAGYRTANASYTKFGFINAASTTGLPILMDWADHVEFGVVDLYMGDQPSATQMGYGMVLNNSVAVTPLTTTTSSTSSAVLTFASTVSAVANAPVIVAGWIASGTGIMGLPTVVSSTATTVTLSANQTIPSGTIITFSNQDAGLAPGGVTIREYQGAAPLYLPAANVVTGLNAAAGITLEKNDTANGTPVPVVGLGATFRWSDDFANTYRFKSGSSAFMSNNPAYSNQLEQYGQSVGYNMALVLGQQSGGDLLALIGPDGPAAGYWDVNVSKISAGTYDLHIGRTGFGAGAVLVDTLKVGGNGTPLLFYANNGALHTSGGFEFGAVCASTTNFTNGLNFYGGTYGIGLSAFSMNYAVESGALHNFMVNGTTVAQITGTGVTTTGLITSAGNPLGRKVAVPTLSTSTGVVGDFAASSTFFYVCTATNTWVRAVVATF
jgi:hypothetical protein